MSIHSEAISETAKGAYSEKMICLFKDLGPYRDPFPTLGPYFLWVYYIFKATCVNAKMLLK